MQGEGVGMLVCRIMPIGGYRLVARLAIIAEPGQRVVRVKRIFEIALMATAAFYGSRGEFIFLLVDMAGAAIGYRVYSHQRETFRGMQFENIAFAFPASRRVARLAIVTELPAMNISMAIHTCRCRMRKGQILVTTQAGNLSVLADKRESGLFVLERYRRLDDIP